MHISVTVSTAELSEMGLTADELRTSLEETLGRGCATLGNESVELCATTVSVEVMPTAAEFAETLRGQMRSR